MFVKRLLQKVVQDLPIRSGNLKASQLNLQLTAHHGIPHTASILAYEPVQRLLAVSSSDGRIKILGAVGVEVLLRSPTPAPCKYMEFLNNRGLLVYINTQNDIEVWDLDKRELAFFKKWETEITSFNVLQGSPFMFVGDYSGTVVVLQVNEDHQLNIMPYVIPAHITLGGLIRAGSPDAPSVVGILPQPDVFFTRLLVGYGNGLMILWGLHETQVLAVRGGTEDQRLKISNYAASLKGRAIPTHKPSPEETDEEDKEICCVCWACPVGSVLAVGYVDGEILLWSFPTIIKSNGQMETEFVQGPVYSGEPIHKVDLAPGEPKMPVVSLIWGASAGLTRGVSGRLYMFGGREVGRPEVLTVLSLDALNAQPSSAKLLQWDLNLEGPFADMSLLPPPGGNMSTPAAAFILLMMPGLLHVFDDLSISSYFGTLGEGMPSPSSPQPVPLQLPVTETKVTCAKLVLVSNDGMAAKVLLQLPPNKGGPVPSTLPAGTKWPISGGLLLASSSWQTDDDNLYITGHENGLLKIWHASSGSYMLVCTVENQSKMVKSEKCSVSAFEFCASSGLLAVGDESGLVFVYKLQKETCEVKCYIVGLDVSSGNEELLHSGPGFRCILIQSVHKAAIETISIASGLSRLAVGDENGMVSLLDLRSRSVISYDHCFPNLPSILSIAFSLESLSSAGSTSSQSPPQSPSQSKHKPTRMFLGHVAVLYVVGKDASILAIDASTGATFGSGAIQPKHPSTAVSMHLLDAGGAPVSLLNSQVDDILEAEGPMNQIDASSSATSSVQDESASETEPDEQRNAFPEIGASSEAMFLLLCCSDSLRLYSTSSVMQGLRTTLRKVKLERKCNWSSTFRVKGSSESGLLLMFSTGELEFRSLPDLELLKKTSLSSSLNWEIDPNLHCQRTIACNINGQLVVINRDVELIQTSVLEDDTIREKFYHLQLYDKDLAKAADAAITYARNVPRKKSQTTIQGMQGLLGGVLKELKNALDIEKAQVIHVASELPKLFTSRPFTVIPIEAAGTSVTRDTSGSSVSSQGTALDIDDIDVEVSDAESAQLPVAESSSGNKFAHKLSGALKSLKGKERSDEDSNRMKLFDGKNEPSPPKAQTVDDIRAKYGHPRKSQDVREVSSVMEMARNKLAERGEKLQDIGEKTSELEDNAQNFASMAEELAKRLAQKKWWEL